MRYVVALCFFLISACATSNPVIQVAEKDVLPVPKEDVTFSVLSINDVYRIDGLASSGAGGLDRIRSLREAVEKDHHNLLFLHGGDLLYPSFMSRLFGGTQMVDILNMMDGDDTAFDDRMFVVFGNHEFDEGSEEDVFGLQEHIFESQFNWMAANVTFTEAMGTKIHADNLYGTRLVELDGLTVGLFGLTIAVDGVGYASFNSTPAELKEYATRLSTELRAAGADIVVGLTHVDIGVDEQLLHLENGPDLIFGGHEHEAQLREHNGKFIFKADADAITARLVHITLPANGSPPIIEHELIRVQEVEDPTTYENIDPAPEVTERIDWWLNRTSSDFCNDLDLANDCLEDIVGKAGTTLVAEELSIRSKETNMGNFIADLMADAGRLSPEVTEGAALVSFINSGSLRLNQNILAKGLVYRQHIEELIQYDGPLFLIKISADQVRGALTHAAECQVSGAWLQISGMEYTAHTNAGIASDISIGGVPLTDQDIYAVTVQFVADPDYFGNQDGYTFKSENIIGILKNDDGSDVMLRDLIYKGIDAQEMKDGFKYLAPALDGRIKLNRETKGTPVCST